MDDGFLPSTKMGVIENEESRVKKTGRRVGGDFTKSRENLRHLSIF